MHSFQGYEGRVVCWCCVFGVYVVSWCCVLMLCVYVVFRCCVLILCVYVVFRCCTLMLCFWYCVLVLCFGFVCWCCVSGIARWCHVMMLCFWCCVCWCCVLVLQERQRERSLSELRKEIVQLCELFSVDIKEGCLQCDQILLFPERFWQQIF